MQVITLKAGYFGKLREVGEVFEVDEGVTASWFVPVGVAGQTATPEGAEPVVQKPKPKSAAKP